MCVCVCGKGNGSTISFNTPITSVICSALQCSNHTMSSADFWLIPFCCTLKVWEWAQEAHPEVKSRNWRWGRGGQFVGQTHKQRNQIKEHTDKWKEKTYCRVGGDNCTSHLCRTQTAWLSCPPSAPRPLSVHTDRIYTLTLIFFFSAFIFFPSSSLCGFGNFRPVCVCLCYLPGYLKCISLHTTARVQALPSAQGSR